MASLAQEPAPSSADTFANTRTVSVIVCAFDDGRQALIDESLRAVLGHVEDAVAIGVPRAELVLLRVEERSPAGNGQYAQ